MLRLQKVLIMNHLKHVKIKIWRLASDLISGGGASDLHLNSSPGGSPAGMSLRIPASRSENNRVFMLSPGLKW